jgi:hypothetical protein
LLGIELLRTPTELRLQLAQEMTQAVNLRQRLARSTVCNVAASVPMAIRTIASPITSRSLVIRLAAWNVQAWRACFHGY